MKTFKGSVSVEFKVVAHDEFLQSMRAAAQAEDVSVFLKKMQEAHPVNDDAFLGAILSNGIRIGIAHDMAQRFSISDGLGATVSPAKITITESVPDHDAPVAVPQVIRKEAEKRYGAETLKAIYGTATDVAILSDNQEEPGYRHAHLDHGSQD